MNAAPRTVSDEEVDRVVTLTLETVRQGAVSKLAVRVLDARSPISKVEYSLGGGPWQLIYPLDGLADSPDERYEIPLANEAEINLIVIRATDLLLNVISQPAAAR